MNTIGWLQPWTLLQTQMTLNYSFFYFCISPSLSFYFFFFSKLHYKHLAYSLATSQRIMQPFAHCANQVFFTPWGVNYKFELRCTTLIFWSNKISVRTPIGTESNGRTNLIVCVLIHTEVFVKRIKQTIEIVKNSNKPIRCIFNVPNTCSHTTYIYTNYVQTISLYYI